MKKFGFTLAEILITLGIIGVVAALTAPALINNSGQAKIGPTLAKFVSTWEVAAEQYMQDNGISRFTNLISADNVATELPDRISRYMIMSPAPAGTTMQYKFADGTSETGDNVYALKDGATISISHVDDDSYGANGSYAGYIGTLIYDIDGGSGNNKVSSEVFSFLIDDSGTLVPYGSNAHKFLVPRLSIACDPSSSVHGNQWACTGAIADNNWKADY